MKNEHRKNKKNTNGGDIIRRVVWVLCLLLFLFSGYELFQIYREYKAGTDAYDKASDAVNAVIGDIAALQPVIPEEPDAQESDKEVGQAQKMERQEIVSLDIDWTGFPDSVIGWIQVENDEVINYPVIQSEDNDYYLSHLYDGTVNNAGSIFVDYRNEGFDNRHCIIYGHNMKNGSMFSHVKKYREQDYADKHRYIYIATPDGKTKVFYVYSCQVTDALGESDGFNAYQISFEGDEWQEWVAQTKAKSLISSEIELPEKCNIITLSTCMSGNVKTERCVIHAVQVANEKLVAVDGE